MADTAAKGGGDVIEVGNQFYILATASRAAERTAVLQHDDTFAIFDYAGDMGALGAAEQGLYNEGTRFLSRFTLRVNGKRPLILSSRVKEDNELFVADLTNPDIPIGQTGAVIRRDLVHIFRSRFLWKDTWYERIRLWNYSQAALLASLCVRVRGRLRGHLRGARHAAPAARRAARDRALAAPRRGSAIAASTTRRGGR